VERKASRFEVRGGEGPEFFPHSLQSGSLTHQCGKSRPEHPKEKKGNELRALLSLARIERKRRGKQDLSVFSRVGREEKKRGKIRKNLRLNSASLNGEKEGKKKGDVRHIHVISRKKKRGGGGVRVQPRNERGKKKKENGCTPPARKQKERRETTPCSLRIFREEKERTFFS